MPLNGMNIGTDYLFQYYDGNTGALVQLGDVQTVSIAALKHYIVTRPYNDFPRFGYVPDGFKIDFTITRNVSVLEDLMVTFQLNFQSGALMRPGYLNETINNWDGTVSRYQYQNFVVYLTMHGYVSREKNAELKF